MYWWDGRPFPAVFVGSWPYVACMCDDASIVELTKMITLWYRHRFANA